MRKLLTICSALAVSLVILTSPVDAAISYGTPSPALDPVFGTLIDFDDQPSGTPILPGDYVALGVASITELTLGPPDFARYPGSQSQPNYIGTGIDNGWNGTIRIDLAKPASQIGIGVADSAGGAETLSVYNSGGVLLESYVLTPGANIYAVITRPSYDISRIELTGEFFAADDLQFDEVLDIDIKPGSCPNPFNGKSKGSVPVAILGSATFDVTTIDLDSLRLEGVPIVPKNVSIEDVSAPVGDPADCYDCFDEGIDQTDGYPDLVVKFYTQDLAAAIGPAPRDACVELTLTGLTLSGEPLEASDSMVIKTK
jgi:hypothetical protein